MRTHFENWRMRTQSLSSFYSVANEADGQKNLFSDYLNFMNCISGTGNANVITQKCRIQLALRQSSHDSLRYANDKQSDVYFVRVQFIVHNFFKLDNAPL